jgi:hypothetical protein
MNSQTPRSAADIRKQQYRKGMRVRLLRFAIDGGPLDDNQLVPHGTLGTITIIDDLGTLHVRWDNSATLGLTIHDHFEVVGHATT